MTYKITGSFNTENYDTRKFRKESIVPMIVDMTDPGNFFTQMFIGYFERVVVDEEEGVLLFPVDMHIDGDDTLRILISAGGTELGRRQFIDLEAEALAEL